MQIIIGIQQNDKKYDTSNKMGKAPQKNMQNLKFRAWDSVRKKFMSDMNFVIDPDTGQYLTLHENNVQSCKPHMILNQWIGYTDCNGKKIYEGDIVEVSMGGSRIDTCTILFKGIGFWFVDVDNVGWVYSPGSYKLEIIGNIYETDNSKD